MEAGSRAVAYTRVSTTEQGVSGLGLDAQEAAIRGYATGREWIVSAVHREVASGAKKKRRPILDAALDQLETGDVLVVAKADRLARSLSAYVGLIDRSRSEGWSIVSADGSVDLTTPHGRAMSAMAAVFGELEAELIGDRTKVALHAAKQRGTRLGRRPVPVDDSVARDVRRWRSGGDSFRVIAARLNAAGVRTATGGLWHATTVKRVTDAV